MKISKTGERVLNNTDFFQNVGEADCELYCGRLDPMLKLYPNCELMLTKNDDVKRGKANTTRMNLVKVILKHGTQTTERMIQGENIILLGHLK